MVNHAILKAKRFVFKAKSVQFVKGDKIKVKGLPSPIRAQLDLCKLVMQNKKIMMKGFVVDRDRVLK